MHFLKRVLCRHEEDISTLVLDDSGEFLASASGFADTSEVSLSLSLSLS